VAKPALCAVVNKYGSPGMAQHGQLSLVNIAFALFRPAFNIEINEFLTVYDGDPKLPSLGGIK
jgi:hypothetical protein